MFKKIIPTYGISSIFAPISFTVLILKDYLASIGFENAPILIFVGALVVATITGYGQSRFTIVYSMIPKPIFYGMLLCTLGASAYSYLVVGQINTSCYIWSFWIAFIFAVAGSRWIIIVMLALPFVNFILQCFESATGEVLFTTIARREQFELGTSDWLIGEGVLRTKGVFQGPLHIVSVSMMMILLLPNVFSTRVIMLLCTYLGAARLGLVLSVAFFVEWYVRRLKNKSYIVFTLFALLVFCTTPFLPDSFFQNLNLNEDRLKFIGILFDFNDNNSNVTRYSAWVNAIQVYSKFDYVSMMFGRFNDIRISFDRLGVGGGTESDWLLLLVDDGLVTFTLYLVSFGYFLKMLWVNSTERIPILIILFVAMNLFPCLSFLVGAIEFWLVYFVLMEHYWMVSKIKSEQHSNKIRIKQKLETPARNNSLGWRR
jgi:hypothetical protein